MVTVFDADAVASGLPWPRLVDALRAGFAHRSGVTAPLRHHHRMTPGASAGTPDTPTLLLMPAWGQAFAGVKVVGVFPTNPGRNLPTVTGTYLLMRSTDGTTLALIDGAELTARRTAAASVLAATYLADPKSSTLTLVGSGLVARNLARAYASLFPIEAISIWNHRPEGAKALARTLQDEGLPAAPTTDLGAACARAQIVSCATLASEPLVEGRWLTPGTHLDLVGAFTPAMRESDDEAVRRAAVYVDHVDGALVEAGDIVQALSSGALRREDIVGDLFDLASGAVTPTAGAESITLFKSVGHALEDLTAAVLLYRTAGR